MPPHPLVKRAQREGSPLIDGETATFVWRGQSAPSLIGDFNDWDITKALSFQPVASGLWTHKLTLPREAYMEYAYVRPGKYHEGLPVRVPDPLNPQTWLDQPGTLNHFFYMSEAAPTPLGQRKRGVPHGTVTRHSLRTRHQLARDKRIVYLYQPPTSEPSPLLVVFDGLNYLRRVQLTTIVDNLIAQGRIRPLALALLDNHGLGRNIEYACNELMIGFVGHWIINLARAHLNLVNPETSLGAYGVLGAAISGLAALYTGLRLPHLFGRVLSQSGAFNLKGEDTILFDLVQHFPSSPLKIWMSVSQYEWLLPANRRMHELLVAKGYAVTYREHPSGHNCTSWRNEVWQGLELMFGV